MKKRGMGVVAAVAGTMVTGSVVRAANENTAMMQYLGYTNLFNTYGVNLSDGSNVSVSLVESSFYPTLTDGRFAEKTLTVTNTATVTGDGHATIVGARFFGNDVGFSQRSVAPKIGLKTGGSSVQVYNFSQFTGSFLLNPGLAVPYGSQNNSRVASHAYAPSDYSLNYVARMDYIQQRDDFLQVVGNNFYGSNGDTFNSVVVVSTDGAVNSEGNLVKTDAILTSGGEATPYTADRVSPTVTGPYSGSPSDAIGQVAGVVGLLVSRGKTAHSNVTYATLDTIAVTAPYTSSFTTFTKPGYTVHSGDTSEVVKAALMAGALRNVATYTNGGTTVNGITDYRAVAANQSINGLDYRWGAGMVNAENSYKIIDAGEANSMQDGGTGAIGQYGFDYDQAFGGANGTNATAQYDFTANASGKFMASLVWNVKVAGSNTLGGNFDSTATLHNLDLVLTDMTTGGLLVQRSTSLVDNTETVWTDLVAGHHYRLTVTAVGTPFNWDYGLAWRSEVALTPTNVPEPGTLSIVGAAGCLLLRRRRRRH